MCSVHLVTWQQSHRFCVDISSSLKTRDDYFIITHAAEIKEREIQPPDTFCYHPTPSHNRGYIHFTTLPPCHHFLRVSLWETWVRLSWLSRLIYVPEITAEQFEPLILDKLHLLRPKRSVSIHHHHPHHHSVLVAGNVTSVLLMKLNQLHPIMFPQTAHEHSPWPRLAEELNVNAI